MITVFLAFVLATWSPFVAAFTQSSRHLTVKGQPFPSLLDATIEDLQLGLAAGLFTSVDLVDAYLARIDEVNGRLNVVTEINPDARLIARQLDLERASGVVRG